MRSLAGRAWAWAVPTAPPEGALDRGQRRAQVRAGMGKLVLVAFCLCMVYSLALPARADTSPTGHWEVAQETGSTNGVTYLFRWVTKTSHGDGKLSLPNSVPAGITPRISADGKTLTFSKTYVGNGPTTQPTWRPKVGGVSAANDGTTGLPRANGVDRSVEAIVSPSDAESTSNAVKKRDELIYFADGKGSSPKVRQAPPFLVQPLEFIEYSVFMLVHGAVSGLCDGASGMYATISGDAIEKYDLALDSFSEWSKVRSFAAVIRSMTVGFLGIALVASLARYGREVMGRPNGYEMMGSYIWLCAKYVVLAELIMHSDQLMNGIFQLGQVFSGKLTEQAAASGGGVSFDNVLSAMERSVSFQTTGQSLIFLLLALVVMGVCFATVLYVVVLCVTRIVEAYVMVTFAGIPLAMMGEQSTKHAAISFFKSFAAVALQLSVVIVIVAMAPMVGGVAARFNAGSGASLGGAFMGVVPSMAAVASIFLLVKSSRSIAAQIVGTNG